MRRSEIWTASGGPDYAGKPRPALIVQDDAYRDSDSVVLCGLTTDETGASLVRVPVEPTPENGLLQRSHVMIDKVSALRRTKLGKRIGFMSPETMSEVDRILVMFLGLASRR